MALLLALRHPNKFRAVIPVEAADYAPGFYLDWWRHPHANAAQVCASGTWDLMAPQSPEKDRWLTWHYYTQGSEAFKGDLYFYSVDHDLRNELKNIDGHKCPVIMLTGTYDYLTPPEATENTARQIKGGVYIDCTFGGGSYSKKILNYPETKVIAIDRDKFVLNTGKSLEKK